MKTIPTLSVCFECFRPFHSNQHYCCECGTPSKRGRNHADKKDKA